ASLNPVIEEAESVSDVVYALRESRPRSLFDREVAAVERMIRGRRKNAGLVHDEWTEFLNDLEASSATVEELDDAFRHFEALDQYDEGGAIIRMSAHERTVACGRVDREFTADDLPEQARFLAGDLIRTYASGVEIEEIWEEINAHLDVLFPVKGRTAEGARYLSRANLELQRLTREAIEGVLEDCFGDYHLTAMRNNRAYRRFYARIRSATDTKAIGELMKQAYEARQDGELSVKHFITLNTAADNQRERLLSAPLSSAAYKLIEEIVKASGKKLGYLGWAMYGANQPSHPIHKLNSCEQTRAWEVMTARKAAILLPRLYAKLLTTWGRALPHACIAFLAVFKEFFELPRLRMALSAVRNKRPISSRRISSAPKPHDTALGHPAVKRGAAARLRSQAASCAQQ